MLFQCIQSYFSNILIEKNCDDRKIIMEAIVKNFSNRLFISRLYAGIF